MIGHLKQVVASGVSHLQAAGRRLEGFYPTDPVVGKRFLFFTDDLAPKTTMISTSPVKQMMRGPEGFVLWTESGSSYALDKVR